MNKQFLTERGLITRDDNGRIVAHRVSKKRSKLARLSGLFAQQAEKVGDSLLSRPKGARASEFSFDERQRAQGSQFDAEGHPQMLAIMMMPYGRERREQLLERILRRGALAVNINRTGGITTRDPDLARLLKKGLVRQVRKHDAAGAGTTYLVPTEKALLRMPEEKEAPGTNHNSKHQEP